MTWIFYVWPGCVVASFFVAARMDRQRTDEWQQFRAAMRRINRGDR